MASEAWTALGTGVIAAFTVVLAWVSHRQARLIRETLDLARDEFNTTHRPRIRVRAISYPRIRKDVPVTFNITVVNSGDNDATITAVGIAATEHDGEAGYEITLDPPTDPIPVHLPSGARCSFERTGKHSSGSGQWGAIEAGANSLIITGEITYKDKVGIVRQTGFAREWDRKRGGYAPSKIYAENEYED